MTMDPGEQFAGYRIVRQLGSGGMGEVYLVENGLLKRQEALKVVRGASIDPNFVARFTNEARMVAALDHPAIVTIFAYGVEEGIPWFTMSYVAGGDLTEEKLRAAEVSTVLGQVAGALDYAHSHSVVHRDIKPANIVVRRGADGVIDRAILLDFGIAKAADSAKLTATASFIGSAAYMAPEVIRGGTADALSDQYSLACSAFEVLAGRQPFAAVDVAGMLMAHLSADVPSVARRDPSLAALDPVFDRAMAKDPARRYRTCVEFATAFAAAVNGPTPPAPTPPAPATAGPGESVTAAVRRPDAVTRQINVAPTRPQRPPQNQQRRPPSSAPNPTARLQHGPPPRNPLPSNTSQPFSGTLDQRPTTQLPTAPVPAASPRRRRTLMVAVAVAAIVVIGIATAVVVFVMSPDTSSTVAGSSSTTNTTSSVAPSKTVEQTSTAYTPTTVAGRTLTEAASAIAGTCLTLRGANANSMTAVTVSCDGSDDMSFISAGLASAAGTCTNDNYIVMRFPGFADKLCMAPNMQQGRCYQINPDNIVEYGLVGCDTQAAAGATIYRVAQRVNGTAKCAVGSPVNFDQPSPLGYCLVPQRARPTS